MADQLKPMPTAVPVDNTPETTSATPWKAYLLADGATIITEDAEIKPTAEAAKDAIAIPVAALPIPLAIGTVLDFGGVKATLSAPAEAAATSLAVTALAAKIPLGATAFGGGTLQEIPLSEQFNPDLPFDIETIKVHGRNTPIRKVNGVDMTMTVRTVASLKNPVVNELKRANGARKRIVLKTTDGYALLGLCIVIGKPSGQTGQSQRWEFTINLTGRLFEAYLMDENPAWKEVQLG